MPDEPVELVKKTYKVVGPRAVFGHPTGEEFTVSLSAEQEAFYTGAGHLKEVKATTKQQGKEE